LDLEHGVPSHDTFSRIFRLLDPEAFQASFQQVLDALEAANGADSSVVAIDGKTLRRSYDAAAARAPGGGDRVRRR
jgi:hypothetical protein